MHKAQFTGNIVHAEIYQHNDADVLALIIAPQDSDGNSIRVKTSTSGKLLTEVLAGVEVIGDRVVVDGVIDLTSVTNSYAHEDQVHLLKFPRILLRNSYVERVSKREEQSPLTMTIKQLANAVD